MIISDQLLHSVSELSYDRFLNWQSAVEESGEESARAAAAKARWERGIRAHQKVKGAYASQPHPKPCTVCAIPVPTYPSNP